MFRNRREAGRLLADKLQSYRSSRDVLILALPRGGVVVGDEIAEKLHLPLSVLVVKKLGAPQNPELAVGAVAPNGVRFVDDELAIRVGADENYLLKETEKKAKEIKEKEKIYHLSPDSYRNYNTIILVDDGVATGATTLAAVKYIKGKGKRVKTKEEQLYPKVILAVPVIARDTYETIEKQVDEIIALETPEFFSAVGQFFQEFGQVSDDEVIKILLKRLKN